MRHVLLVCGMAAAVVAGCSSSAAPGPDDAAADSPASSDAATGGDAANAGDGAPTDTWASWAQGFFQTYCVECHDASDPTGLDFTKYAIVDQNLGPIRCGVCVTQDPSWNCASFPPAKQFPINDQTGTNPKPTDAERDRIVAWIGAGAPP